MRRSGESRLGRLAGGAVARWEDRLATAHGSLAGRRGRAWVAALAGGSLLAGFCAMAPAVGAVGRVGARAAAAAPGTQLWVSRYNGPGNGGDRALSVAVSPDGQRVFVAGRSRGSSGKADYATIAYNAATGARLWVSRYNGPGDGFDYAAKVVVSPDGTKVYVTGSIYGGPTDGRDYATIAYDASTGARLWVSIYRGRTAKGAGATAIVVSPDGGTVYVTGKATTGLNMVGFGTVAYDAATGAQLWVSLYHPPDEIAAASAIGVSPGGKAVFVTGISAAVNVPDQGATVAYDAATGDQLWAESGDSALEVAASQAISPDGGTVFVTGYGFSRGAYLDTVAYDAATGAKIWETAGPRGQAFSVAASPDGTAVFITGFAEARANKYVTVAYDSATGKRLWGSRYIAPSGFGGIANAVAVSPDGHSVYVTGGSGGATSESDYATVAYDAATGAQLWARRYNGPANGPDTATALAVSPTGRTVFVTGYSTGATSGYDWATIAYRT